MSNHKRTVRETAIKAQGTDGATYTLVVYDDDTYGIAKDGVPIPNMNWRNGQMKECCEQLVRLAGLDDC